MNRQLPLAGEKRQYLEEKTLESDLKVEIISPSLNAQTIDVIVCGSIGAIEAPRFIRAIRRMGANVRVTLTDGGAMFITAKALEWASANSVCQSFSGLSTHLATSDAIVIAELLNEMRNRHRN